MNYHDLYAAASDAELKQRVKIGLIIAAVNVAAEAEGPDAELSRRRKALASHVLKAPSAWTTVMVFGVLTNGNVGVGGSDDPLVDDGTLAYVISSIWDAYALAEVA